MKFGKRLRRECHAEWVTYYLDYKELKKKIKTIAAEGLDRNLFFAALEAELAKLNDFFSGRVALFEEMFPFMAGRLEQGDAKIDSFMQWCEGLDHLRKYVVLNYVAVRKIVKKFDKNTSSVTPVPPILSQQPFYNSLSLARLITKTEILVAKHNGTNLADSFVCPVCLEVLHAPVVLSCAHIFCWSCLARAAQFTCNNACPVCRKEMPLDPTAYKVDSLLQRFLSQNIPENEQKKGFGYFFQTPAPPRTMKVILAPARFGSTQRATRFAAYCNARHTDAQVCVMADNVPAYKPAVHLNSSKVLFIDTQVEPTALRKGETLVPFVESEGETPLGRVVVVGFRVGLPGSIKPVFQKSAADQSKPTLVFMKYLSFECLANANLDDFLQKNAGTQRFLFILDSPQAQSGVWNGIPYAKLTNAVESSTAIPYQEILVKKGNIAVYDRLLADDTLPSSPAPAPSASSSSTFKHAMIGLESFPKQPLVIGAGTGTGTPAIAAPVGPPTAGLTVAAVGQEVVVFEDNVWGFVWRGYVAALLLGIAYFLFCVR